MLFIVWTLAIAGHNVPDRPVNVGQWRCEASLETLVGTEFARSMRCSSDDGHKTSIVAACGPKRSVDVSVMIVDGVTIGIKCEVKNDAI